MLKGFTMRERKVYRVIAKPTPTDLLDPGSEKELPRYASLDRIY